MHWSRLLAIVCSRKDKRKNGPTPYEKFGRRNAGRCPRAACAAEPVGEPGRESGKKNPLKNVYFGEQHLHTVNSPDAFALGTRNTPDDACKFCKGGPIKLTTSGATHMKKAPIWYRPTEDLIKRPETYFGLQRVLP
jgi:hypothetical protein